MTVAAVLSLGFVAAAFAERGGNQGSHGNSNQSASASASDNNGSSNANTHPNNHGGDVSAAAHSIPPGPGHGEEVSEVAQANNGHAGGEVNDEDDTPTATGVATDTPTATQTPTATATSTGTTPFTPTATATEQLGNQGDSGQSADTAKKSAIVEMVTGLVQTLGHLIGI
jgi:hypothetical protein